MPGKTENVGADRQLRPYIRLKSGNSACWRQQIRDRSPSADRPHLGAPNRGSKIMKRPKRDTVREERIHNEAIADANGPEEQAMGVVFLPR